MMKIPKFTKEEKMIGILAELGVEFHFKLLQEVRIAFPYPFHLNGQVGRIVARSHWLHRSFHVKVDDTGWTHTLDKRVLRPRSLREVRCES